MRGFEEFLGRNVTVEKHSDYNIIGMSGIVVDETREIVTLSSSDGIKKVSKSGAMFKFETGKLNGDLLKHRPQDRIKKVKI
tara:strand:+ start:567 stop:809 length:243 start_codon:yes stop_codon:yes gene_type:complete